MPDRVVVVGSINVDHTITVGRFPGPGETVLGDSLFTTIGGKGANQAVAAAKAGASVVMVGVVGDDNEGEQAVRRLSSAGVDTAYVTGVGEMPTGTAWITVVDGENSIIVVPGANSVWEERPSPPEADVVLCQLETPIEVAEWAAQQVTGPTWFMLNAAPSQQLSDELLARCDVLIVNEHELAEVAQVAVPDGSETDALVAAARHVLERGVGAVAVTLGARGALLLTADETWSATPPHTPEVVDSTGAGDAFCGVFAARVAAGDSPTEALRWAVTAGSLSVRRPTAQESYADLDELRTELQSTPFVVTGGTP